MKYNFLLPAILIPSFLLVMCFTHTNVEAKKLSAKTQSELAVQLVENEQRYGSVSQSILVKKKDQVLYRKAYGLSSIELSTAVNENNQYPMYSLAKLFASVALMNLVEKGKVNLDESITSYLPELPKSWSKVTIRHCLNHTSGIPEYFSMEYAKTGFPNTLKQVFSKIAEQPFQFEMGERNNYNNTNFLVIGAIIEKVTQRTYLDVINDVILKPLSMNKTFYAQSKEVIPNLVSSYWGNQGKYNVDKGIDWPSYSFTHSGLYSTKADLQQFIAGVVAGKIVSENTLYKMWQPMKLNNGQAGRFASGWDYFKEGEFIRVSHEGGNRVRLDYHFKATDKSENYTSIYLTNGSSFSNGITTHLVDALMSIISPSDFPTLVLQERLLDGAFNKTLAQESKTLFAEIVNNRYINEPGTAEFITERGYTLYYSSQPKHSIALFEFYSENLPNDASGWERLGEAWLATGDQQKAVEYFRKALSLDGELSHVARKIEQIKEQQKSNITMH